MNVFVAVRLVGPGDTAKHWWPAQAASGRPAPLSSMNLLPFPLGSRAGSPSVRAVRLHRAKSMHPRIVAVGRSNTDLTMRVPGPGGRGANQAATPGLVVIASVLNEAKARDPEGFREVVRSIILAGQASRPETEFIGGSTALRIPGGVGLRPVDFPSPFATTAPSPRPMSCRPPSPEVVPVSAPHRARP